MTYGIKHWLAGVSVCLWEGHIPVPGVRRCYGTYYNCVVCDRCHKVI